MHAQTFEAFHAVMGRDGGDHIGHVVLGGGVIHLGFLIGHAVFFGMPLGIGGFARGDQGLGGDAAVVQTVAAHFVAFKQDHRCPHLYGACCDRQPSRAGADDQQIGLNAFHD